MSLFLVDFFIILYFLDVGLRDPACQLHGGLFNPPLPTARNANPGTKTFRTAAPPRIYCDAQKCMKSQQKGIGRNIKCCKEYVNRFNLGSTPLYNHFHCAILCNLNFNKTFQCEEYLQRRILLYSSQMSPRDKQINEQPRLSYQIKIYEYDII